MIGEGASPGEIDRSSPKACGKAPVVGTEIRLLWLAWLSGLSAGLRTKMLASLNSNQGTYLGCRPGPHQGAHERQPHIGVSLPLFLPPFPSLK